MKLHGSPKLRDYQEEAVRKIVWACKGRQNSIVVAPTASGKTWVIAESANRIGKPILILVPSKELLEQDLEKLSMVVDRENIGIYSASMNSKEVKKYTLATIQSAYKHPELFTGFGLVFIDECHFLNSRNLDGMYNTFFQTIGNPTVIGLTATPFRLDSYYERWGPMKWQVQSITTIKMLNRYQDRFWKRIIHTTQAEDLVEAGYLCPLTYHDMTLIGQDKLKTNKSKSDFDLTAFEADFRPFVERTVNTIKSLDSKSVLVFCASIPQAYDMSSRIAGSEVVTGATPKRERAKIIEAFKKGVVRVVFNVGVLTVGFDHPELDAIVIARPTRSLALHLQILGRGMRIAEGKDTCHVYDLVGNVKALGTAESLKTVKLPNARGTLLWNVTTDANTEGWHYARLYQHKLTPKTPKTTMRGGEDE